MLQDKNRSVFLMWQLISPYMLVFYFLILLFYINPILLNKTILFFYLALTLIPLLVFQIIQPKHSKNIFYKLSILIGFTFILLIKEPQFETLNIKSFFKILYVIFLISFILKFFIEDISEIYLLGAYITLLFYYFQFFCIDPFYFILIASIYTSLLFFKLARKKIFTTSELLLPFLFGIATTVCIFILKNLLL